MKYNKGSASIAIIITLVVLLAVGGAFYLGRNTSIIPIPKPTPEPSPNPTPCSPSSVTVLSPNGGETYTAGQQITVKWSSCDIPASFYDIVVALHQNGDWQNVIYLTNATINDGSETFTIPATTAVGNYKVRVGSAIATVKQDFSDGLFVIKKRTQTYLYSNPSDIIPESKRMDWKDVERLFVARSNDKYICVATGKEVVNVTLFSKQIGTCPAGMVGCQAYIERIAQVCGNQYILLEPSLATGGNYYGIFQLN